MRYVKKNPTLDELVLLASEGFCQRVTPELRIDVENHLEDTDFCLSVYDDDLLVACMLCKLPIPGVLYIAGTLVLPAYQGHGIKAQATKEIFNARSDLSWFAGRTQSPIVWSSVRAIASEVLPNPEGCHESAQAESIRAQLAVSLGMTNVIQKGFYGGPLYGEQPINRDGQVQTWWDSICNFERGDAVLYIARF
ncbi:hypothetical protein HQ487_03765 [Candidatus Uhrbacteria bacterium]|nr:hypothetical protein [Candidatus Uhrbacteria bacterium]